MEENNQRRHYIVQTIVGPVCTSCETRVSNNKTLFTCCANTIQSHWKNNQCSNGNSSARRTERELLERLRELHQRSIGNKDVAFQHFRDGDEGVKRSFRHHCSHCGLVDKESRLKRYHKKCPGHAIKAYVLSNKYNQQVPESFLNDIIDNKSPLRRLMKNVIINAPPTIPPPPTPIIPSPPSTPPTITPPRATATATNYTTSEPPSAKKIKVTDTQLNRAIQPNMMFNPHGRWQQITEQMETLGDPNATKHTWFFQHICLGNGTLMDKLIVNAKYQQLNYHPEKDDIKLKALLHAAKLWFQSQTANIDVREIDTHLRAALYNVGSRADIKDLDIWGNTFVPTNDLEHVLKEVKYIIQFLYRGGHIEEHLIHVLEEIEQASPYDDSNPDRRIDDFARRILVTNLIPAIVVNSVLEEPNDANGHIPIYDYIAARSTKLIGDDDIKLRNPNDISRSANAMLRVIRHAICTYLHNHSKEVKHDGNEKWRNDAKEIITHVQQAPAIGHICLRLVMSKYEQQKTPQTLNKAVDISSGDVFVAGAYFSYERWSRAIQHAINLVEESLKLIFQNHDALEKWRHLDNNVQWSSDVNGTCVRVATEDVEAIEIIRPQDDLIPMLGEHANVDTQTAINICFSFEKFAFAYMGVGAARGTEVTDMDDETNIDFVFNTIVYYLICKKGEKHGRYTNEPVQHYLPPSISRIVLLIKLMLWPKAQAKFL